MANRLASETSPYLLQHRDNPVEWYPWGEEALVFARAEDRPILLSVGYSACHWCHVMERESFEDPEVAAYMNEHFVNIKVDREERPDIDALYMEAVQGIAGQGGWPMTVFCDSEAVPFHAGTYFPPQPIGGRPSFRMVLEAVVGTYRTKREEIRGQAPDTAERLGALGRLRVGERPGEGRPGEQELDQAVEAVMRAADQVGGGFGGAPKFPPASTLEFLFGKERDPFVALTLDRMLAGGIYDQLGGGFSRYAVDGAWLVPHFEKMLYDNALLARVYLHGWQRLGHERYRRVCGEVLDWALREMRRPDGGFYAALDADSEGEEGRFYVWSAAEFGEVLGEAGLGAAELEDVREYFGVSEAGNCDGANVLHLARGAAEVEPEAVERARPALLAAREGRVRPGLDSKCLTSWNGLMIAALAEAGAVLGEERYLAAARECAGLVLGRMRDAEGRLLRTLTGDEARLNAYLEDHAFLLEGLLVLYEATFEPRWYEEAVTIAEQMLGRFGDEDGGGFFTTSDDHERLIARRKDLGDHPIPAGNSSAALGLLRLGALSGQARYRAAAEATLRLFVPTAVGHADAFGHLLQALELSVRGGRELALVCAADGDPLPPGADLAELASVAWAEHRPRLVRAGGTAGAELPELLRGREAVEGRPTAYVCEDFTCRAPVQSAEALRAALA
ncbi:MAG TPA: thioredoxin domain-containing protein [Solirubrobacterales bacterium]|nr:thioredoxin domain-containing protein [Solirubrobacterales bacterium]